MGGYTQSFNETKGMAFLIEDDKLLKSIIVSGIKSPIVLKKDLIVNHYTMKHI